MSAVDDISIEARARRLKQARSTAFSSAAQAASALQMNPVTVRAHENGQNGFPLEAAEAYARTYGVSLDWLLTGRDDGQAPSAASSPPRIPVTLSQLPGGKARLELNLTLPFATALQILALVEEAQK